MIYQGDCLDKLKELPENSVDSIVTDPPYELGFMGKSWDNTGIANNPLMWAECLRVLKPGGHMLAFSGTRTYHRMACAIEDAGFEVRDMIEWVYGSGFPKSLNIGKAVDKMRGKSTYIPNDKNKVYGKNYGGGITDTSKGTSEYEGWGTALKPAHEPICMARKPLAEKTVAKNCLKWGTGGINIDESRVGYTSEKDKKEGQSARPSKTSNANEYALNHGKLEGMDRSDRSDITGRFPANLIHDNSEEVRECFPNESERFFKSILYYPKASKSERNKGCEGLEEKMVNSLGGKFLDKVSIRKNEPNSKEIGEYIKSNRTTKGLSMNELSKHFPSKSGGITGRVHNWESGKELPTKEQWLKLKEILNFGNKYDEIMTEFIEVEANEKSKDFNVVTKNNHPTVKPIALMEYLIKMVTPKGGIVLDPFAGSGSTGVAAKQNGYDFIGIEMEAEYIKIAESRINAVETGLF